MGQVIKKNNHFEYCQNDGETTAWFSHEKENMVLAHEGDPRYKIIFYILIFVGILYLGLVFTLVH